MRKLFAVILCLVVFSAPSYAQQTKAALTTEINTNWPDNNTGAITPALLRSTVIDIVNSYQDLNGTSAFNCGVHQWLNAFASLSVPSCQQPNFTDLLGGIATPQIGGGINASTNTFLRGDLTWQTPSGSGTVTEQKNTAGAAMTTSGNCDNTSTNAGSPCQYNFAGSSTSLSDTVSATTWTPADGSGASLSLTINDHAYYKIGKLVHIIFNITYPATANGATAKISGLPVAPYTSLSGADQACQIILPASTNQIIVVMSNSTSTFEFWDVTSKSFLFNSTLSSLNLYGQCTYLSN